nr:hypothetical protein [Nocardia terpenica]
MEVGEICKRERGDDVAVENEERRLRVAQFAGRELHPATAPERLVLNSVIDGEAEAGAVACVVGDHLVLITAADGDGFDAVVGEPGELIADDRCPGYGHHRFGGIVGVGPHAGGLSTSEDQGLGNRLRGHNSSSCS